MWESVFRHGFRKLCPTEAIQLDTLEELKPLRFGMAGDPRIIVRLWFTVCQEDGLITESEEFNLRDKFSEYGL